MSKQAYNNQTITQYLLGALPEAETERLDELSFTDDEFADALMAAEQDLVDAYVQGELTGAALEQFTSSYLASPLRRERAKFAQAFRLLAEKDTTAQAAAVRAKILDEPATKQRGSGLFSALNALTAPRPALQWGFAAAALALLIAGGWLAFDNARLRQQVSQTQARRDGLGRREQELHAELEGQRSARAETEQELARAREERERLEEELARREAQAGRGTAGQQLASPGRASIASFVLTPQMRGAGNIRTINIPADTDYVAMRLELEPNEYPSYRVTLLEQSGNRTLWRSRQLRARSAGGVKSVGVNFSAGLLKPRVYVLRVTGVEASGASEIIGDHPFRVVNSAPTRRQ